MKKVTIRMKGNEKIFKFHLSWKKEKKITIDLLRFRCTCTKESTLDVDPKRQDGFQYNFSHYQGSERVYIYRAIAHTASVKIIAGLTAGCVFFWFKSFDPFTSHKKTGETVQWRRKLCLTYSNQSMTCERNECFSGFIEVVSNAEKKQLRLSFSMNNFIDNNNDASQKHICKVDENYEDAVRIATQLQQNTIFSQFSNEPTKRYPSIMRLFFFCIFQHAMRHNYTFALWWTL